MGIWVTGGDPIFFHRGPPRLTRLLNETSDIESRGGRLDRNEIGRLARLLDFIAAVNHQPEWDEELSAWTWSLPGPRTRS